ncbi:hypothetical protein [Pinibacter soli]|uniref:Oxidase n=1 Tax=Pinibacter soli TaxID=3044211 RepID=A0ABT6RB45_9BACT|nr:hypothetical protein [Pinibacter soli]MDI3319124.1 hypothetical protein [Pinibacter soli]
MKDFILDESDDLLIKNGDFVIDTSDEQQQRLMLLCAPGSFKNAPDKTVGIERFLMDDDVAGMLHAITARFKDDGCPVNSIEFNEQTGDLSYNAKYVE